MNERGKSEGLHGSHSESWRGVGVEVAQLENRTGHPQEHCSGFFVFSKYSVFPCSSPTIKEGKVKVMKLENVYLYLFLKRVMGTSSFLYALFLLAERATLMLTRSSA